MNRINSKQTKVALLGAVICLLIYIPVIIKGPDMRFIIHDELDGDFLTYYLHAKHLLSNNIPELFDGAAKSAMTPPAPAAVLLFILFSPAVSAFLFFVFVAIVSYVGMFLLANRIVHDTSIAAVTAILFTCLPFYYVYGLSVMGQPLLVYALFLLWDGRKVRTAYVLILLFALNSSLILVGYADILIGFLFLVVAWISKQDHRKIGRVFAGGIELIMVYLLININLIKSIMMPGDAFVTHKKEWIVPSAAFFDRFSDLLINGVYHCTARHKIILIVSLAIIAACIVLRERMSETELRYLYLLEFLVGVAVLIALFAAFWGTSIISSLRNSIGGPLLYFQIDRFYWLYPGIWFVVLALALKLLTMILPDGSLKIAFTSIVILLNAWFVLEDGTIAENLRCVLDSEHTSGAYASIDEFYQPEMFEQAAEIMGEDKAAYKVGSVGLFPAIALYNGYYCIDGYSNNYSLDYKHAFRKVIAKELDKDETLKTYFDNWGNRCYLFSSELGQTYYIHKDSGQQIKDLQLDYEALRKMNCRCLFSAVPIDGRHLKLIEKLSNQKSYYDLYVYEVIE